MATATGESSKADKAKLIAEWANNGLGFRKESTLVSSRGNEKLEEADVVPLLQGDLATLLGLASTHIVSSQQASLQRMRLAAYSTQHVADKAGKQFAYTSLRSTVSDMAAKKQQLESEIGEAEHETHAALQKINELESRLGAAEERVRHSRLQVFIKQAMAENLRRLSRRMKALIQEMTDNASVAQTSICRRLVDELPVHDGRGGFGGGTPMEVLSTLVEDTGRASLELLEQAKKCQDSRANEAYEMRRTMVANLIVSLKELQDRYVALWSSVSGLESQLAAEKHTLENKLEHVSGQLNIKALSNSGQPHDYKSAILKTAEMAAIERTGAKISMCAPAIGLEDSYAWTSDDQQSKIQAIAAAIEQVRRWLSSIHTTVTQVRQYAESDVALQNKHLQMALRHTDLREAWNGVSLPRLQFISQNASRASAAVFKAADKSVACKSHVSSMRSQTLSDIARETSMMACQTNEAIVARLGSQLLRDIQQAHVTAKTRRDLVADFSQFLQLAKARNADQPETQEHSVETAVEALCDSAQRHRASARSATDGWIGSSSIESYLLMAGESANTEDHVVHTSDASGRLFNEPLAEWYARDGASYADYLKQLKIARASESRQ